jgi:5-methylthioadenosine/S-adenosylhomocysteine deaminase
MGTMQKTIREDHVDTRIRVGLVYPAAGAEFADGWVEVSGDRVSHVGAVPTDLPARDVIDASGMILLPGLVNTHCHTSQQLARGLGDDVDLLTWLHERIWPYEAALSPADVEVSTLACAVEQIRNGVTTLAEPGGRHVDAMAKAIQTAGLRALLGRSTMDSGSGLPEVMRETTAACLEAEDELAERWHGAAEGRIRVSYTLRTIFNCSDELIVLSADRARCLGTVLQMHIAEVPEEVDYVTASRGTTVIRHLGNLGVLGPRFLAIHAVWLDDGEMDLLAEKATPVSHNAASAMRVLGLPRVADMLERGITVGLGTDGAPTNNRMSLIDEMYVASLLQKSIRRDPTAVPARQVVQMATRDGARALSWDDEIGTIETGKAADLVLVDPATANMTPVHDAVSSLVTSMKSENVDSVMCAGRWLMRHGRVTVVDEEALLREAQARADALKPEGAPWPRWAQRRP